MPSEARSPPSPSKTCGGSTLRVHARCALDGLTLRFDPGTLTAIMGPSGSGKSTLLHVAAGLDLRTSGAVTINGWATASMSDDELTLIRRTRIGFVFQFFN